MKKMLFIALLVLSMVLPGPQVQALEFKFATAEEAAAILLAQDEYYNRMSPAEIAIRVESVTPDKTPEYLKAHYAANVLDWPAEVQAQFQDVIDVNLDKLAEVEHLLPDVIYLVRSNKKIEGGFSHTQDNAIIFQVPELSAGLLFHETFHILSRYNLARHDSLYGLIGFKGCDLHEPMAISTIHLTNPDAPVKGYYLPVEKDGQGFNIISFLYAARPAFDPAIESGFGGHFGFGLLKVDVAEGVCTPEMNAMGAPLILGPGEVTGFFETIGGNTNYIIHPEEVLADNFKFLMTGKNDLPNPEILERLNDWLMDGK